MFEFERLNDWLDRNTPEAVERRNREYAPPWWFVIASALVIVVLGVGFLIQGQPQGAALLLIGLGWALAGLILRSRMQRRGR